MPGAQITHLKRHFRKGQNAGRSLDHLSHHCRVLNHAIEQHHFCVYIQLHVCLHSVGSHHCPPP